MKKIESKKSLKDVKSMSELSTRINEETSLVSFTASEVDAPKKRHSPSAGELKLANRRSTRIERLFVQHLFVQIGMPFVEIVLWDGTLIGDRSSPTRRIVIRSPRALRRLLFDRVAGFGEGFMADEIAIEGDLTEVLTALDRGLSRTTHNQCSRRLFRWPGFSNSISAAKSRVHHHYDIGNDFYQLWLDRQCVYTCAYYSHPDATLEQAQTAKLDYICRKLRLKAGETVIEAGSGWGALALHMARNYGVKVRAFNLSHEQNIYARDRASREGLSARVEFIEDDYRSITQKYDAFVSVGMLEHVGEGNYRQMGKMIDRALKRDGRGLIHSIGRIAARPLDSWTVKYIFPGAYAPSLREMMDLFECGGFSVLDVENLRIHYARTCAEWLARFERVTDQVLQMFDERFVRMWRLYLAASSAAFENGDLQLFQVLFARSDNNDIPLTRADWYSCKRD